MSRRRTTPTVMDERQRSLPLGGVPVPPPPSLLPGSLGCSALVCGLVSYALDEARQIRGLNRAAVAARMSELTGERITEPMLNAMTAESHEGHRFPLQWLPALIAASGCIEVLQSIADKIGAVVLVGEDANAARLGQIEQQMALLKSEKVRLQQRRSGRGHHA